MPHQSKPLVPVIVGPTASGKTAVAGELAKHWDIFVISADSRQIYRGLDIGTAKPDPGVLARVPHVGLDMVDPGQRFSAGQFVRSVPGWLDRAGPGRQVVVVGGTGFYIKAVTDGLFHEPKLHESNRARLHSWISKHADLERWAHRLDPQPSRAGRQRAARAIEVALLTGYPLSWWHRKSPGEAIIRPWFVRLVLPRERLYQRINDRVDEMLGRGWVSEVERVLATGIEPTAKGLDAVGYREIVQFLAGRLTSEELPERIARSTRRYAKRQETWFKHQLRDHPVVTVDATENSRLVAEQIDDAWSKRNN